MSKKAAHWSRRKFLRTSMSAGATLWIAPLTTPRLSHSQSPVKNRVTIAHGVGVYSLNPYAVNTSPLQAAWGSVMEPLIDADYKSAATAGCWRNPGK